MTRFILPSLLILALAACGSEPAGKTTSTLNAVEVEPGTISDSMIILDDAASDGTAVDNSVPDDGTKKEAAKPDETNAADEAAPESEGDNNPEAVDMPVAKKAITADSAAKKGE